METWNRIPPSEPKDYFYAFLAKIIRALSIDQCRERTRLKRYSYIVERTDELEMCIPAVNDVADDVDAKFLGKAISRYLYTLSDEKQVMFMRRYFYLDTVSEIAKRLSISDSKVTDAVAYGKGIEFTRILMSTAWLIGAFAICQNTLQAMGAAVPALLASIIRQAVIFIPAMFILQGIFGARGLIWAQPVADVLFLVVVAIMLAAKLKRMETEEKTAINK